MRRFPHRQSAALPGLSHPPSLNRPRNIKPDGDLGPAGEVKWDGRPVTSNERRQRDPQKLHRLLRAQRPPGRGVLPAGAAQRPDADVHQCRHGAVQERLHRPGKAALQPRRHRAEMRARRRQAQRPRQCRLHRAPPHLLRDARQLLLRRLFQGTRDRTRLEPDHQGIRPAQGPAGVHRLCRRRRRLQAHQEDHRAAGQQDFAHRRRRQFLVDGRHRPVRPLRGNLLRPRRAHPRRPARLGRGRRRPLHRDLEPGVHAVRAAGRRQARQSSAPLDRHRHGAGAHRGRLARHARQLRHRSVRHAHPRHRRGDRRRLRRPAESLAPGDRRPPARRRPF